jgi:hypothetical protein
MNIVYQVQLIQRIIVKNMGQNDQISRIFFFGKSPYSDNGFQQVFQNIVGFFKFSAFLSNV